MYVATIYDHSYNVHIAKLWPELREAGFHTQLQRKSEFLKYSNLGRKQMLAYNLPRFCKSIYGLIVELMDS